MESLGAEFLNDLYISEVAIIGHSTFVSEKLRSRDGRRVWMRPTLASGAAERTVAPVKTGDLAVIVAESKALRSIAGEPVDEKLIRA